MQIIINYSVLRTPSAKTMIREDSWAYAKVLVPGKADTFEWCIYEYSVTRTVDHIKQMQNAKCKMQNAVQEW